MDVPSHDAAVAGIFGSIFAVGVYAGKRLIDIFLPPGRHHRWIERYTEPNDDDEDGNGE